MRHRAVMSHVENVAMRPLVIVIAVVALGVLVTALARLGGTVAQLRELRAAPVAATAPREAAREYESREPVAPFAPAAAAATETDSRSAPPISAASGDEHIMRALAADPEFQRAAAELLLDPDPAVQAEAREMLRALGAAQSE